LEQLASFGIIVGKRLAIVAARDTGSDFRHLHNRIPQTLAVDFHVAGNGHGSP